MFDKDILKSENINSYDEFKDTKQLDGKSVPPLSIFLSALGFYYYMINKYPTFEIRDAELLVYRDDRESHPATLSACCGGGEVK